jgi:hypothetical protein
MSFNCKGSVLYETQQPPSTSARLVAVVIVLLPIQIDRAVELNHGTYYTGDGVAARC